VAEINLDYNPEGYESMRMEGAVYSLLSPHPLIVNTYGNCALSIFNEAMTNGDMEKKAAPYVLKVEICKCMYLSLLDAQSDTHAPLSPRFFFFQTLQS
jgi:hypothetical protein